MAILAKILMEINYIGYQIVFRKWLVMNINIVRVVYYRKVYHERIRLDDLKEIKNTTKRND